MDVSVERSLGPDAVPELVALYDTYDWWADRDETELRRALAATDEVVALRAETDFGGDGDVDRGGDGSCDGSGDGGSDASGDGCGDGSSDGGDGGSSDGSADRSGDGSGDLVAAARVLTDYTYYAMVFDVVVHESHRGEGLGRELLAAIVTHPPLSAVDPSLAAREGLVPFYEACGFEDQGRIAHPDGEPEELRFLSYRRDA